MKYTLLYIFGDTVYTITIKQMYEVIFMKATVDRSGCIGCGLCASTCPDVFVMDDENLAEVVVPSIPDKDMDSATEARDNCPVSVISIS